MTGLLTAPRAVGSPSIRSGLSRSTTAVVLVVAYLVAATALYGFSLRHHNRITGDEPHYLVVADSLLRHRNLAVDDAYRDELRTRAVYPAGLAPVGAEPTPEIAHAQRRSDGRLFSVHGLGLPVVVAVPAALGGVAGAKLALIGLGVLAVVALWRLSGTETADRRLRLLAVAPFVFGLPLLSGVSQIYPDILAGVIGLVAVVALYVRRSGRTVGPGRDARNPWVTFALGVAIGLLPWLHTKNVPVALVLAAALAFDSWPAGRRAPVLAMAGTVAGSVVALAIYHAYAFGSVMGSYEHPAELSKTSLMVLLGLHVDQAHGAFVQNPALLVGVACLPWLVRRERLTGCVVAVCYVVVTLLNATHPNWYGGSSFAGRFHWTGALLLMVPAVLGLAAVGRVARRAALVAGGAFLLVQLVSVGRVFADGFPYNPIAVPTPPWYDAYLGVLPELNGVLPLRLPFLYDDSWAFRHAPNWLYALALAAIVGLAIRSASSPIGTVLRRAGVVGVVTLLGGLVVGALSPDPPRAPVVRSGAQLASQTGRVYGAAREAKPGRDDPGFLTHGPYMPTAPGRYSLELAYRSPAGRDATVGTLYVIWWTGDPHRIREHPLTGTGEARGALRCGFALSGPRASKGILETRVHFAGTDDLVVERLTIEPAADTGTEGCVLHTAP